MGGSTPKKEISEQLHIFFYFLQKHIQIAKHANLAIFHAESSMSSKTTFYELL